MTEKIVCVGCGGGQTRIYFDSPYVKGLELSWDDCQGDRVWEGIRWLYLPATCYYRNEREIMVRLAPLPRYPNEHLIFQTLRIWWHHPIRGQKIWSQFPIFL